MDVSPPLPLAPPALVRGPSPLRFMVLLCVVSAFHALDDTASPSPVPLKARIPNRAKKKDFSSSVILLSVWEVVRVCPLVRQLFFR